LGKTDVEDELHTLKPEELGTDMPVWCCSTTTQVNTSVSQRQCHCRSSHPGCYSTARQEVPTPGSYAGQNSSAADESFSHPFIEEEILATLQKTKPATAPGYDNIFVEFLKNLGPKVCTWLFKFFSRIMATIPLRKTGESLR